MKKEQLYFKSIDHTNCYDLQTFIEEARDEGLDRINLIEAIPDKDNPDYIFCGHEGEVGERNECKKSICNFYSSKSGRGVCEHRGNLYRHGDEVGFDVPQDENKTVIN